MRKWLFRVLLLILIVTIGFFGRQVWKDSRERQISDAQVDIKPDLPPTEAESALPLMDFTGLKEKNSDIIGWITVDGAGVDYPIVQGTDNSYYLKHTAEKISNKLGALFLDYRSNADFSDFYSVVYGHNMKSGHMFGGLTKFKDKDFFNRNVTGMLYTPNKTYRLEFFAVAIAYHISEYYQYVFPSLSDRDSHLSMIKETAKLYRDIGVTPEDTLLALSTCSYEFKNARTLIIAKLSDLH